MAMQQQKVTIEYSKAEVITICAQARRAVTLENAIEGVRDTQHRELLKGKIKRRGSARGVRPR